MANLIQEIQSVVEETIAGTDLFMVDVMFLGEGETRKLLITLDGESESVSIDECVRVSRAVEKFLEEKEDLVEPYRLEVSSPGLSQPLQLPKQYKKQIGRELEVTLNDGTLVQGKLESCDSTKIEIRPIKMNGKIKGFSDETQELMMENILKSNIIISF